jgi:4-hydroxybutyrate CoA-transferase
VKTTAQEALATRQKSLDEAMGLVDRGDLVALTILAPGILSSALQKRAEELGELNIRFLAPRELNLLGGSWAGEREIEVFIGDTARPSHDAHDSTYLPNTFMLGMKAFDAGREEARMPDVLLTPCSEPNDAGYVHFGPHMWTRKSYARRVKKPIALIDPNIEPVHGDIWMHVSEFAAIVDGAITKVDRAAMKDRITQFSPEAEREERLHIVDTTSLETLSLVEPLIHVIPMDLMLRTLGMTPVDPEAQTIGGHLQGIIRDGDTIQVGVGEPSALMFKAGAFDRAHDLGLHTELGSPGLAKLWASGILNNSQKQVHRGRSVAVAWSGCDQEDLEIIRDNPAFELYDPDYLLHPRLMSQNETMTSINSAIAVDLLGQIASEDRFGGHMVNGTGGQPDTHMSAALSRRGRAITVMRSTAIGGSISKVVAQHDAGTLITVPRYLADTIVTEHGVARLLDKNHRQRADELISIAHPDFRAELRAQARQLWFKE